MKKFFVLTTLLLATASSAFAMDHRSQYGVGAGLGANFPAPWGDPFYKDNVKAKAPYASAWGRWIAGTPEIGLELAYAYIPLKFQIGTPITFTANSLILGFISRQNPWGSFHPFYGFGAGWAKVKNMFYPTAVDGQFDVMIYKLTAGIEFEMNEHTDVGLRLDHYTIFRERSNQRTMHMIAPSITLNHYFGTPAPIPAPAADAAPAPAPVAAPAPAPESAPVVSEPVKAEEAVTAPAHTTAKAKKTPKKPAKKPVKKKKKLPTTGN